MPTCCNRLGTNAVPILTSVTVVLSVTVRFWLKLTSFVGTYTRLPVDADNTKLLLVTVVVIVIATVVVIAIVKQKPLRDASTKIAALVLMPLVSLLHFLLLHLACISRLGR